MFVRKHSVRFFIILSLAAAAAHPAAQHATFAAAAAFTSTSASFVAYMNHRVIASTSRNVLFGHGGGSSSFNRCSGAVIRRSSNEDGLSLPRRRRSSTYCSTGRTTSFPRRHQSLLSLKASSSSSADEHLNDNNHNKKKKNNENNHDVGPTDPSRRNAFSASLCTLASLISAQPASAGLVQFPLTDDALGNSYSFMRAGQDLWEADDMWGTNPMFLTNREASLSDLGIQQVLEACASMTQRGYNPSVVNYSLAAKCVDTANLLAAQLHVGRDRIKPEYTLLDPRGIGCWDMGSVKEMEPVVWALDEKEAGAEGRAGVPPPNDDGTANESLSNQVTRLRQLLSVLETLYSGDSILLIFPDGTGPAVLTAMIGGIPLNRVHELEYQPGEIRYDVTKSSALGMLPAQPTAAYLGTIRAGQDKLQFLRDHPDEVVSIKEKRARVKTEKEEVRLAEEEKRRSDERKRVEEKRREDREKTLERWTGASTRTSDGDTSLSTDDNFGGRWPGAPSVAALGLAAAMATWKEKDVPQLAEGVNSYVDESNDYVVEEGRDDAKIWDMKTPPMTAATNNEPTYGRTPQDYHELKEMEDNIQKAPIDIPEFSNVRTPQGANRLYDDPLSEEDRVAMAEKAMDEYLNRDDGHDAWLNQLADMMD